MKQVYLNFRHEDFDELSERSIRQFMRKVASVVREAQLRELSAFVFSLDLKYAEKRSIADRLEYASRDVPPITSRKLKRALSPLCSWPASH